MTVSQDVLCTVSSVHSSMLHAIWCPQGCIRYDWHGQMTHTNRYRWLTNMYSWLTPTCTDDQHVQMTLITVHKWLPMFHRDDITIYRWLSLSWTDDTYHYLQMTVSCTGDTYHYPQMIVSVTYRWHLSLSTNDCQCHVQMVLNIVNKWLAVSRTDDTYHCQQMTGSVTYRWLPWACTHRWHSTVTTICTKAVAVSLRNSLWWDSL